MKFPPPCGRTTTPQCPGAVIDIADTAFLNPGTKPFAYGADVLIGPDDNAADVNIVQKGVGLSPVNQSPNQWKIELGDQGEARCVIVTKGTGAVWARSTAVVADGQWHRIRCTKRASSLTIDVDAASPVSVPLPPDLEMASPNQPMRLGGNNRMGTGRYTGALDNVYFRQE